MTCVHLFPTAPPSSTPAGLAVAVESGFAEIQTQGKEAFIRSHHKAGSCGQPMTKITLTDGGKTDIY
jgi:hypothetical protein